MEFKKVASQLGATVLAAVTALPGFVSPPAYAVDNSMAEAVRLTNQCMNDNGWPGGATLQAIWQASLPNPAQKQTAASCIAGANTQLNLPTSVQLIINNNPGIGQNAHKGTVPAGSQGGAYVASAVPGCNRHSSNDPAIDRQLKELYNRCVLARANAETTNAESVALEAQKKYECILNQDQVNALIAQENRRINAANTAKSLFTLLTASGSAAAFATKNDELGWPLAAVSLAGVLFFPQRQMIQTGNYEQCAIIRSNLAKTNGL